MNSAKPALNLVVVPEHKQELTVTEADLTWSRATDVQRARATARMQAVRVVLDFHESGRARSTSGAAGALIKLARENPHSYPQLIGTAKEGELVGESTLKLWVAKYKKAGGVHGLLDNYTGTDRTVYGWEAAALALWQKPQNLEYTNVCRELERSGHKNVTYSRVKGYLQSLPADVQRKGRIGPRKLLASHSAYTRRTTEGLPPGHCWQGDGNTIDVYLRHSTGKRVLKAELTLWLDVASRYVVGWHISEDESADSTLFALSNAMTSQNHIPIELHIDNGSGYVNNLMSDESTGFYAKFGMTIDNSRPYRPGDKGHVERFFKTMHGFLKRFDSYAGKEMDREALQLILKKHKQGKVQLPTVEDFEEDFKGWLIEYHNRPHSSLDGRTPAQVYSQKIDSPLENVTEAIFWPRELRTVQRSSIKLHGRDYGRAAARRV